MFELEDRKLLLLLTSLLLSVMSLLIAADFLLTVPLANLPLLCLWLIDRSKWIDRRTDKDSRQVIGFVLIFLSSLVWALVPWLTAMPHVPLMMLIASTWTAMMLLFTRSELQQTGYLVAAPTVSVALLLTIKSDTILQIENRFFLVVAILSITVYLLFAAKLWLNRVQQREQKSRASRLPKSLSSQLEKTEQAESQIRELGEQVQKLKIDLSAASMAKMEFLSTMSHEIRTPLNGIIPLIDIIMDTELDEFQRDYLSTARTSATQMQKLIDDLLDYSKVEAGKLTVETVGLKLKGVIAEVCAALAPIADNKGLALTVDFDENISPLLQGDPTRIRQVLTNLVSNAIKFSEQGTVTIKVEKVKNFVGKETVKFSVIDEGIGIKQNEIDKLFNAFTQADNSSTRKFGGTGIGLAISHKIVDLMRGSMGVESEYGQGSTFWFELTLSKSATVSDEEEEGDVDVESHQAFILNTDTKLCRLIQVGLTKNQIKSQVSISLQQVLSKIKNAIEMQAQKQLMLFIDFDSNAGEFRKLLSLLDKGNLRDVWICVTSSTLTIAGVRQYKNVQVVSQDFDVETLIAHFEDADGNRQQKQVEPLESGIDALAFEVDGGEVAITGDQAQSTPKIWELENISQKVLLVEDNEVNLKVAQKLMDYIGFPFDVAENGMIALEKAKKQRYRMILMDCQMPVMDGYFCTRRIRQHEEDLQAGHTPIIAMTANAMLGDREKCLDAGMDDYMSKPLNRYILEKTLKKWDPFAQLEEAGKNTGAVAYGVQEEEPQSSETEEAVALGEEEINSKWLDVYMLTDLKEFMGEDIDSLLTLFQEESPQIIKAISHHLGERNFDEVKQLAHTLKSTSANIGAVGLNHFCKKLEKAASQGSFTIMNSTYKKLKKAYEVTIKELHKYQSLES